MVADQEAEAEHGSVHKSDADELRCDALRAGVAEYQKAWNLDNLLTPATSLGVL